ncbi:3-methyl-D-ornithine--L-lysine ligase [Dirofilaria immitis]
MDMLMLMSSTATGRALLPIDATDALDFSKKCNALHNIPLLEIDELGGVAVTLCRDMNPTFSHLFFNTTRSHAKRRKMQICELSARFFRIKKADNIESCRIWKGCDEI